MFKTFQGVTEDSKNEIYLRPETAQGIFVNFSNIQRTSRKKVPFGVAQIGKSFRNEITPGNFIFRVREFEQMELEFFCKPGTDLEWFEYWRGFCRDWLYSLNIKEENLRLQTIQKRSFVSIQKPQQTLNISSRSVGASFGALPTEQTMTLHSTAKQAVRHLSILIRQQTRSTFRMLLSRHSVLSVFSLLLLLRLTMKKLLTKKDTRVVLRLHPTLAPYKACVLPLSKKLNEQAGKVYEQLSADFMTDYDDAGSIGKRYRRQDEIGTPFCITYDFESVDDGCVTVRDRDTMQQERVAIDKLNDYIAEKIKF